jgi:hypothetical protein
MATYNTLKNLTDALTELTESHAQVEMCRWGVISDVANPKDGIPPQYNYVFYIIDQVTLTRTQYVVNITGIFMTRCKDTQEEILTAQSSMAEIAKDIYSYWIIQGSSEPDWGISPTWQASAIPFVERFQDTVAGVTVQFQFEIDSPASKCFFPTKP